MAAAILAGWACWPLGVIVSIWMWDGRPGLTGFVLALTATTWGVIVLESEKVKKRTAEQ